MPQNKPAFTFANANARKLLALPVYAAGGLATLVVPRAKGLWVFGCGSGIGEGALALYRYSISVARADQERAAQGTAHATRAAPFPRRMIWLARDSREAELAAALGIPTVVKTTFRGFWLTLRAQVIVVTHGLGDANRYSTRGAFILQLWHGIPFKRINLDSPRTTSNTVLPDARWLQGLLKGLHRLASSTISMIPAASELSASRLRTAFGLPAEKVVVTGDPRDDVLCQGTDEERTSVARALLARTLDVTDLSLRVILYAPTWRDGDVDPGVPTEHEWALIAEWLAASDSILVVRPHPLGVGNYAAGIEANERIYLLDSSRQSDINPVLPAVDVLITDYSSIALDFSLLGRPIAFLAADLEHYAISRGLYEDYAAFSGGHNVTTWAAIIHQLRQGENDSHDGGLALRDLATHATALAARHHAFRDGRNTQRVHDELIHRLETR